MAIATVKKNNKNKTGHAKVAPTGKKARAINPKSLAKNKVVSKTVALKNRSVIANLTSKPISSDVLTRLQMVTDRMELEDLLQRIARGMDRADESLLRTAFHTNATIDCGAGLFQGTASDYIAWILDVIAQSRISQHMLGNMWVQLDGDTALVESYCQIYFRLEKPTGREDVFIGSRWLDRIERRPSGVGGIWRIAHRKCVLDWVRTESASDIFYHRNPDALWSGGNNADPSYQMDLFPGSQGGNKLPTFLGRRYDKDSIKL